MFACLVHLFARHPYRRQVVQRWVSWQRIISLAREADSPTALRCAWSSDGRLLAIARDNGAVHLLPVERGALVPAGFAGSGPCSLSWVHIPRGALSPPAYLSTLALPDPLPATPDERAQSYLSWEADYIQELHRGSGLSLPPGHLSIPRHAYVGGGGEAGREGGGEPGNPLATVAHSIAAMARDIAASVSKKSMAHPELPGSAWHPGVCFQDSVGGGVTGQGVGILVAVGVDSNAEAWITVRAHGTIPLLHLPLSPYTPTPCTSLSVSLSPSLRSLVATVAEGGGSGGGTGTAHLVAVNTAPLAAAWHGGASSPLPVFLRASPILDACMRYTLSCVSLCAQEWAAGIGAWMGACTGMEEEIVKASTAMDEATLRATCASYYPSSPTPIAQAETYLSLTIGSTNGGVAAWLEGRMGEAGLVRLARSVEGTFAAVESLIVPRAIRACELSLLALTDLLQSSLGHMDAWAEIGWQVQQVEDMAVEVTHMMALLQTVRSACAHARAVYIALVSHWRVTLESWVHAARERAEEDEGHRQGKKGGSRLPAGLAPSDATLVRQAVQPASAPTAVPATVQQGAQSSSKAQADPLGLGFDTSANSDPLGLGFNSSSAPVTASPSLPASPTHDPFLPYSITTLLTGGYGARDKEALQRAGAMSASLPASMAQYMHEKHAPVPSGPVKQRDVSSQCLALWSRWCHIASTPCRHMSERVLARMKEQQGVPVAQAIGVAGNASGIYHDSHAPGGPLDAQPEGSPVQGEGEGAHIVVIHMEGQGEDGCERLLLLAVPAADITRPLQACVLHVDVGRCCLASAWHCPAPEQGQPGQEEDGALMLVTAAEGQAHLVKVQHHSLSWSAVPPSSSSASMTATWAAMYCPSAFRLSTVMAACRALPSIEGAVQEGILTVSGPRGCAVVGLGPAEGRRVFVLDLAEDEEEEGGGAEQQAVVEEGTGDDQV